MIEDIQQDARNRMSKSIESFKAELSKIRTGRAHPSLLNHITGQYRPDRAQDSGILRMPVWKNSFCPKRGNNRSVNGFRE